MREPSSHDPPSHGRPQVPPPERWPRIEALFDAALELPPDGRVAWVRRACGDDAELRTAVERLLRAHERAGGFLETSARDFAAPFLADLTTLTPPLAAGARVGPYRVVREIGRGGMGAVYLAERDDGQYRKQVALKVVSGVGALSDELLTRFRDERQILASIEHPGVARLIDGGVTQDGLPYFIMEYVEGVPIDRYCDDHKLTIEARLALFCAACDAVQHAHRNRIVHRDLKPGNILVVPPYPGEAGESKGERAAEGQVKLLDFGIAKLLAAGGAEAASDSRWPGLRRMTPDYASPEQVRGGPVTPAADVYALGVLLYRLLCGCHPYALTARPRPGIERRMLETRPERPSVAVRRVGEAAASERGSLTPEAVAAARRSRPGRLRRRLRGDLDAIVLKALAKEPEQRYATAGELAADLRRHLEGRAARARSGRRLASSLAVAGAAVVLALLGIFHLVTPRIAMPELHPQRVMVAPLENRTGTPSLDPVGAMAADWIIQGLAETGRLQVVPFSASLSSARHVEAIVRAVDSTERIRAFARETGAGIVVSGSYYLQGDSIYLHARITDVRAGRVLEALQPVSASAATPLAAVETLRERLLAALAPHLDPRARDATRVVSRTPSYEAYREYAEGMEGYIAREDWRGALRRFARAVEHDPDFTLPLVRSAVIYQQTNNPAAADSVVRLLEPHLDRLAEFDREVISAVGGWARADHVTSYQATARAAELAPNTMPHYQLADVLVTLNRPREAVRVLEEIDPHRGELRGWGLYWIRLTYAHHLLGDYRKELEVARVAREHLPEPGLRLELRALIALGRVPEALRRVDEDMTTPGYPQRWDGLRHTALELHAHGYPDEARRLFDLSLASLLARYGTPTRNLGELYYRTGRLDEAERVLREVASRRPDDVHVTGWLGAVAARRGDREEAERISAALAALDRPYLLGDNTYWRARIAALLGDREQAIDLLRAASDEGRRRWMELHHEPDLESLREYPAFRELIRPKG